MKILVLVISQTGGATTSANREAGPTQPSVGYLQPQQTLGCRLLFALVPINVILNHPALSQTGSCAAPILLFERCLETRPLSLNPFDCFFFCDNGDFF
jgi:hypothetical protein